MFWLLCKLFPYEPIRNDGEDYLHRWHLTPPWLFRGWRFYLHVFVAGDGDRCPHDHPFDFRTWCLWGGYDEFVYEVDGIGLLVTDIVRLFPLQTKFRSAEHIHKVVRVHGPTVTLVLRGPKRRDWFFYEKGGEAVYWEDHKYGKQQ